MATSSQPFFLSTSEDGDYKRAHQAAMGQPPQQPDDGPQISDAGNTDASIVYPLASTPAPGPERTLRNAGAAIDLPYCSGGPNGWPLGLMMLRRSAPDLAADRQSSSSSGSSDPTNASSSLSKRHSSLTSVSWSSSDLDTQSTWSFFPDRSKTLGSLIGLRSISPIDPDRVATLSNSGQVEAREDTVAARLGSGPSPTVIARTRSWCPMFVGCGRAGADPEAVGMSPSLAHLLNMEKAKCSKRQVSTARGEEALLDGGIVADNMGTISVTERFVSEAARSPDSTHDVPPQHSGAMHEPCGLSTNCRAANNASSRRAHGPSHDRHGLGLGGLCTGKLNISLAA